MIKIMIGIIIMKNMINMKRKILIKIIGIKETIKIIKKNLNIKISQ